MSRAGNAPGELRDRLVEKGWRLHDDLHYLEAEGSDHSEGAWAGTDRSGAALSVSAAATELAAETARDSPRRAKAFQFDC